jgi:hypothetical protein
VPFAKLRARAVSSRPMPYDAFISYCSEDKNIAEAIPGWNE